ncbi:MAG: NADH:ubiquinone oxidoreductase [Elusimicrobiota bacterium]
MKYLGITPSKPRLAVFDFTCCEGCELQLTNNEDSLVDFLSLVDVVNFREASSDRSDDYDIALVEGAISRPDEIARLKKIRKNAKILVAFGTCAVYGGVNKLRNKYPVARVVKEVYGRHRVETMKVRRISEVVKVDLEILGCPVSKKEVERIVVDLVTGAGVRLPKYPVCVECKQNMNVCVMDQGRLCLGPISRAGCGAPCPDGDACLGCRGPAPDANFAAYADILKKHGFPRDEIKEKLAFFGAFDGVKL